MSHDEFWNQVRRVAQEVSAKREFKATLVATDYNPQTHAVKGTIVPHGIESGWVPIAAIHVGNGWGILCGPTVGTADDLSGSVFDVHFDFGDPNTMVAHHRQFSTPETPPQVQSGEMLLQHQNGNQIYFNQDKTLRIVGQNGSTTYHDANGGIVHQPAPGQKVMTGGDPKKDTFAPVMTAQGPSSTVMAKVG